MGIASGIGNGVSYLWNKIPNNVKRSIILLGLALDCSGNPRAPEELLKRNGYSLERICREYNKPVDKITGQDILAVASQYIGNRYGSSTQTCSIAKARKRKCRMQCGTFISSVFEELGKRQGLNLPVPYGNGIEKCVNSYHVRKNRFEDLRDARPGDIISFEGRTQPGHSAIVAGRGKVRKRMGKSNVYWKFVPSEDGEIIVLHATKPRIGYTPLSKVLRGREIKSLCRHEALCREGDEVCSR